MANKNVVADALNPYYPEQPSYDERCPINQIYQSLPPSSPHNPTFWEETAVSTSQKHLYTGVPNWYPFQRIRRPVGTMYEHDYSQFHETGVGRGKRISYHNKMYPLTNRNVREVRVYSDALLPYPNTINGPKIPIQYTTTLNSVLHTHPNAYIPKLQ